MATSPTAKRYPTTAIALHWLMLALIVAVYACILIRENYPRGSELRDTLKTWHFMLGLSVLTLVIVRIVMRLFIWQAPEITPHPARWQVLLASIVHIGLYAFMIVMPIAGWLILSAEGKTIPFWGLELPPLMVANKSLGEQIQELHETGGTIGYFIVGLHATASLVHHYIMKDNTLTRMLPGKR
jgi:superoxide oxidase